MPDPALTTDAEVAGVESGTHTVCNVSELAEIAQDLARQLRGAREALRECESVIEDCDGGHAGTEDGCPQCEALMQARRCLPEHAT